MGNTFEVWSWRKQHHDYAWEQHYHGEDKAEAFAVIEKLKEQGHPCVKLEWR